MYRKARIWNSAVLLQYWRRLPRPHNVDLVFRETWRQDSSKRQKSSPYMYDHFYDRSRYSFTDAWLLTPRCNKLVTLSIISIFKQWFAKSQIPIVFYSVFLEMFSCNRLHWTQFKFPVAKVPFLVGALWNKRTSFLAIINNHKVHPD